MAAIQTLTFQDEGTLAFSQGGQPITLAVLQALSKRGDGTAFDFSGLQTN